MGQLNRKETNLATSEFVLMNAEIGRYRTEITNRLLLCVQQCFFTFTFVQFLPYLNIMALDISLIYWFAALLAVAK